MHRVCIRSFIWCTKELTRFMQCGFAVELQINKNPAIHSVTMIWKSICCGQLTCTILIHILLQRRGNLLSVFNVFKSSPVVSTYTAQLVPRFSCHLPQRLSVTWLNCYCCCPLYCISFSTTWFLLSFFHPSLINSLIYLAFSPVRFQESCSGTDIICYESWFLHKFCYFG